MASPINTVSKSVVLQPGEPFILPNGAQITFVSDSNSLSTDCATFPATGPSICYKMGWALDEGAGAGVWDPEDTRMLNFTLGNGIIIDLGEMTPSGGFKSGVNVNNSDLYDKLTDPATVFPGNVYEHRRADSVTGNRKEYSLTFQVPAVFGENAYLTFRIGEDDDE